MAERDDIREDATDPKAGMTVRQLRELVELAIDRGMGDEVPTVRVTFGGRIKRFELARTPTAAGS